MRFFYPGDEGSRIVAWLEEHLRAMGSCVDNNFPEAALSLIYSGIDTLGLLAAPPGITDATGDTFKDWCARYIVPRLQSIEGQPITPGDLWGGRCGIVHTSTPISALSRAGMVHEFWYQFQDRVGVNMIMNTQLPPLGLDVMKLGTAFKEGALAFLGDLQNDPASSALAHDRAQHFLRWGKGEV